MRKAIVGLGNFGERFIGTPHNAGFDVIDHLVTKYGGRAATVSLKTAEVTDVTIGKVTLTLIKPKTGMNDSGLALTELMSVTRLDFPEILVVFDDLSLPVGQLRFKQTGRSSAGHRGIDSLMTFVPEHRLLSRLKLGVGPDPGGANRLAYVLSPLPNAAMAEYERMMDQATIAVETWAVDGLGVAMNAFNSGSKR